MAEHAISGGVATTDTAAPALPKRSMGFLIAISLYWFAINFSYIAQNALLLPSQVLQVLFREAPGTTFAARAAWTNSHAGIVLAVVEAPGIIVALLANPFFGILSDRTPGRGGRRRPYVLWGSLAAAVGFIAVAVIPTLLVRSGSGVVIGGAILALVGIQIFVALAISAASAPFHALLPDLVPVAQRGTASGVMGLAYWLGLVGGSIAPALFGFNSAKLLTGAQSDAVYQQGIFLSYVVIVVVVVLMAILTSLFVRETPWTPPAERDTTMQTMGRSLALTVAAVVLVPALLVGVLALLPNGGTLATNANTLSVLTVIAAVIATFGAIRAFEFHPRQNGSFTWVVITRMLVMFGIYIVQSFLLLYMQNGVHATNPQAAVSLFIILLTLAATVSTAVGGWISDRVGRKSMVYVSAGSMTVVMVLFVVAPFIISGSILPITYILGILLGLGYGVYVSVDWALVADVLPSEATFARDMGVWSIAIILPAALSVVFGSWLLLLAATVGLPQLGYLSLFAVAAILCFLGTVTVRYIRLKAPALA